MSLEQIYQTLDREWLANIPQYRVVTEDPEEFFQPARTMALLAADMIDSVVNTPPGQTWRLGAPWRAEKRLIRSYLLSEFNRLIPDLQAAEDPRKCLGAKFFVPSETTDVNRGIGRVLLTIYLEPTQAQQVISPVVFHWTNRHNGAKSEVTYHPSGYGLDPVYRQTYRFSLAQADFQSGYSRSSSASSNPPL